MATDSTYISIREAARLLGVHDNTVRRYADRGLVRVARLPSGVRRLARDDVEALASPTPTMSEQASPPPLDAYAAPGVFPTENELEEFLAMTYHERSRGR
jgi:excisionase family DNA binding protein